MTAHPLDSLRALPQDILARFELGAWLDAKPLTLVDEIVALRRCALYRKAFKGIAVGYPAELLKFDALAVWIRREQVTVDVASACELDRVIDAGIDPIHIVMHAQGRAAAPIRRAVNAGAARFVVDASSQIAILADSADRIQPVVIEATEHAGDTLAAEVLTRRGLELIGLHCRLDDPDDAIGAVKLREMVAQMARIRRHHGVLLTRISLAGMDVGEHCLDLRILRRVAEAIGEVVGEACAHHRYPRPALTVSPSRPALLPA
jgi:diaminopimelate decarboxylase